MNGTEPPFRPVWQRCWCWQYGRCLVDCPTADLPPPIPMTADNWRRAYAEVMAGAMSTEPPLHPIQHEEHPQCVSNPSSPAPH